MGSSLLPQRARKEFTGNDVVTAEFKHKNPFIFKPTAKQIYSCNEAPEIKEDTLAVFSRWIILACNNVFLGKNCDPKILEKLATPNELGGFLNYALEGLKRLLGSGQFSVNENIEALRAAMIRKMNPARAFIEEQLSYENDPKAFMEEGELHSRFIFHCKEEKLPTTNKANLTKNMHEYFPEAKQTVKRILSKQVHAWQFVKMKETATAATTSIFSSENQASYSTVNNQPVAVVADPNPDHEPYVSVVRLESAPEDNHGECVNCHCKGVMEFQGFYPDGSWGPLCDKCGIEELNKLERVR